MKAVAEHFGVTLVKEPDDWVAYIQGTRIRVYDVAMVLEKNKTPYEISENIYPHLTEEQVKAAGEYYSNNPREMENLKQLNTDIHNAAEYKLYECSCGEVSQGVDGFMGHFEGGSDPAHKIQDTRFEDVLFECSCGNYSCSVTELTEHRNDNPEHRLESVWNEFQN